MTEKNKNRRIAYNKFLLPTFRIEADGRMPMCRIAIFGVKSVTLLSELEIGLATVRDIIKICGKSLEISIFEAECAEIMGEITSIHFCRKRRKMDGAD